MSNQEKSTFRKVKDVSSWAFLGVGVLVGSPLIIGYEVANLAYLNRKEDEAIKGIGKKLGDIYHGK